MACQMTEILNREQLRGYGLSHQMLVLSVHVCTMGKVTCLVFNVYTWKGRVKAADMTMGACMTYAKIQWINTTIHFTIS